MPDKYVFKFVQQSLYFENIVWEKELSWEEFTIVEGEESDDFDASINSGFFFKYNELYNYPQIISITQMNKKKSRVKFSSSQKKGNLLNHEQGHFNISEWTRREFQDSVNKLGFISEDDFIKMDSFYNIILENRQFEYDSITKHGLDFVGQIKWNKNIKFNLENNY